MEIEEIPLHATLSESLERWLVSSISKVEQCCPGVKDYSKYYDRVVNNGLRKHKLSYVGYELANLMLRAIRKADPLPEELIVYRGASNYRNLEGKEISFTTLEKDSTIYDDAFMSMSVDASVAYDFSTKGSEEKIQAELEREGISLKPLEEEGKELQRRQDAEDAELVPRNPQLQVEKEDWIAKMNERSTLILREIRKRSINYGFVVKTIIPPGFHVLPLMGYKLTDKVMENEVIVAPCMTWKVISKHQGRIEDYEGDPVVFNLITVVPVGYCQDVEQNLQDWYDPSLDSNFSEMVATVQYLQDQPYTDLILLSEGPKPTATTFMFAGKELGLHSNPPYEPPQANLFPSAYVESQSKLLYIITVNLKTISEWIYMTRTRKREKIEERGIEPKSTFEPELQGTNGPVMKSWALQPIRSPNYTIDDYRNFITRLEQNPELPVDALIPVYKTIQDTENSKAAHHLALLLLFSRYHEWFRVYTGIVGDSIQIIRENTSHITPTAFNAMGGEGIIRKWYSPTSKTVIIIQPGGKIENHITIGDTVQQTPMVVYRSQSWIAAGQDIEGNLFYNPYNSRTKEVDYRKLYVTKDQRIYRQSERESGSRLYQDDQNRFYFHYFTGDLIAIPTPTKVAVDPIQPLVALGPVDNKIKIYNSQTRQLITELSANRGPENNPELFIGLYDGIPVYINQVGLIFAKDDKTYSIARFLPDRDIEDYLLIDGILVLSGDTDAMYVGHLFEYPMLDLAPVIGDMYDVMMPEQMSISISSVDVKIVQ